MFSKSIKLSAQLCKGPKNVFFCAERMYSSSPWHGTTILCVRKDGKTVMAGDGQVSQGSSVVKGTAVKVRRIGNENDVLVGFAGSVTDALALRERLEKKIEEYPGQLTRACVELAKDWRSDKYMKDLEATLVVADSKNIFEVSGNGDVLDPESGVIAVGSGGKFALSAALALLDTPLDAEGIVRKAMKIAGDICVYTNHNIVVEKLEQASASPAQPSTSEPAAPEPTAGKSH